MRKVLLLFILVATQLFAVPDIPWENKIAGTVYHQITDTSRVPVANARVELWYGLQRTFVVDTDSSGHFSISTPIPGNFTLRAWHRDYLAISLPGLVVPSYNVELYLTEKEDIRSFSTDIMTIRILSAWFNDASLIPGDVIDVVDESGVVAGLYDFSKMSTNPPYTISISSDDDSTVLDEGFKNLEKLTIRMNGFPVKLNEDILFFENDLVVINNISGYGYQSQKPINYTPPPGILSNNSYISSSEIVGSGTGWQFFSFSIIPEIRDPAEFFRPYEAELKRVETYEGGVYFYEPNSQKFNTLGDLNVFNGYWVNWHRIPPNWGYNGFEITNPPDFAFRLKQGWNLIGYPASVSVSSNELAKQLTGKLLAVQTVEGGIVRTFGPDDELDPVYLKPGGAYWVYLNQNATINFGRMDYGPSAKSYIKPPEASSEYIQSNIWQTFIIDCRYLFNKDDTLYAFTKSGQLVGRGIINAKSKCALGVFGDIPSTIEFEGAKANELITVKAYGDSSFILKFDRNPIWLGDKVFSYLILDKSIDVDEPCETPGLRVREQFGTICINYNYDNRAPIEVAIFDVQGHLVRAYQHQELNLTDSIIQLKHQLADGVYWVKVSNGDTRQTAKFVILH